MKTYEKIQSKDGRWHIHVHNSGYDFIYKTDLYPTVTLALEEAKRWLNWARKMPKGKADTIYYILVIPETWAGPAPGAHNFSGLHMKIGRTNNILKRVQNLRTGTSGELIIVAIEPGSSKIEQIRHKQFAKDRRQGEWFVCSPKLIQHAFTTWGKNNLLPKEHQLRILRLGDRIDAYKQARKILGETPAIVNPSINEEWKSGPVFVDLMFTNLAKKDGFAELKVYDLYRNNLIKKQNKTRRRKQKSI